MLEAFCNPTLFEYVALRLGGALICFMSILTYLLAFPYRRAGLTYRTIEKKAASISADIIQFPKHNLRRKFDVAA